MLCASSAAGWSDLGFLVLALAASALLPAQAPEPPATTVLEGRVVDMRGDGVPNAEVWCVPFAPDNHPAWRTRTDGDGLYRLTGVPRGDAWRLYARADGHCCVGHFLYPPFPPMLVVVHEAATVRGVLRNTAGVQVAGAMVFAQPASRPMEAVANATTDHDGRFAIRGVPLGPNRFAAWVAGEGLRIGEARVAGDCEVEMVPADPATTPLTVVLHGVSAEDCARVTLTLTGNHGDLTFAGRPEHPAPWFVRGVPAAGWRVELPDWEWIVAPHAPGLRFRPSVLTVAPGAGPHVLEFVAKTPVPAPTVVGATVHDTDGKPVDAFAVDFYGTSYSPRLSARSGPDGALRIESPWQIEAARITAADERWLMRLRGSAAEPSRSLQLAKGQIDGITIEAIPACAVDGRVLRPDGLPAVATRVRLQRAERDHGVRWRSLGETVTDREGRFALRQLPACDGEIRLVVDGPDGLFQREDVAMRPSGREVHLGDLRLAAAATVEGVVFGAGGVPAAGVEVELRDCDAETRRPTGRFVALVVTDSRGRYRFRGVPAGPARLTVFSDRRGPLHPEPPFDVEAGHTHTFDLGHPGR